MVDNTLIFMDSYCFILDLEPEQVIKIGEVLRKGWGRLGYQIFKVTKLYN
jgi:hypothetical protein